MSLVAGSLPSAAQSSQAGFVADRLVVELRAPRPESPEQLELATAFADDPAMRGALAEFGVHSMYRVFRSGGAAPRNPAMFEALGLHRHYVIELGESTDLATAERAFALAPSVASVRRDGLVRTTDTPNDPLFPQQWGLRAAQDVDIDADLAWDVSTGNASVIVAILDTGCDFAHQEIQSALLQGFNFVANNNDAQDDHGHGTSCAGIVGARSDNGLDIAGIAPNCTLLPVKVLDTYGNGSFADLAAGLVYAANSGASVASMSLTGTCCDLGVDVALQYAVALDVLCISANGNANANLIGYPASNIFGMAVGASSPCDERKSPTSCDGESWGSNYGQECAVVAPGVQIATITLGGGNTLNFHGTSAATPYVAGIAALVRAIDPSLSCFAVRALLQDTAQDQVGPSSEDTPGFDPFFGYGRVNAHGAVLAAIGATSFCSADGTGSFPPCGNVGGPDVGAANSTGSGAFLNASGSPSIALDDLVLSASQLPPHRQVLLLMGAEVHAGVPFRDGLLCIGAGQTGLFRFPRQTSTWQGTFREGPGIAGFSCSQWAGAACIQPGSQWSFQAWYRDPIGPCGGKANLTNAIGVTFRP